MDSRNALSAHYQILRQIGAGGMGVVYLAKDRSLERLLAIKVILRGMSASKVAVKRFYREMEISARLQHPNIVKVYQVGMAESMPYLVMEYVEGLPLIEYCRQKQPTLDEKLTIIEKIASAVQHAHQQKIIHRDIKPANIMVRENGEPVLMDFGLPKQRKWLIARLLLVVKSSAPLTIWRRNRPKGKGERSIIGLMSILWAEYYIK